MKHALFGARSAPFIGINVCRPYSWIVHQMDSGTSSERRHNYDPPPLVASALTPCNVPPTLVPGMSLSFLLLLFSFFLLLFFFPPLLLVGRDRIRCRCGRGRTDVARVLYGRPRPSAAMAMVLALAVYPPPFQCLFSCGVVGKGNATINRGGGGLRKTVPQRLFLFFFSIRISHEPPFLYGNSGIFSRRPPPRMGEDCVA